MTPNSLTKNNNLDASWNHLAAGHVEPVTSPMKQRNTEWLFFQEIVSFSLGPISFKNKQAISQMKKKKENKDLKRANLKC